MFVEKHIKKVKYKYYTDYFHKYVHDSRKQCKMINSPLNQKEPKFVHWKNNLRRRYQHRPHLPGRVFQLI